MLNAEREKAITRTMSERATVEPIIRAGVTPIHLHLARSPRAKLAWPTVSERLKSPEQDKLNTVQPELESEKTSTRPSVRSRCVGGIEKPSL
jgi:hypothetical protein